MEAQKKKILVFRFSAMGDVALVSPIIYNILENNPEIEITFVSRPFFEPLFIKHNRFRFKGVDLNNYKGAFGLYKLHKHLIKEKQYHFVIDLHQVLRTYILNLFFNLRGIKIYKFDKDRKAKKKLLSTKNRANIKLKHTSEKYLDVFKQAGLKTTMFNPVIPLRGRKTELSNNLESSNKETIGIAPFAQHNTKVWGVDKIEKLAKKLSKEGYKILWLGGGKNETEVLHNLSLKVKNSILIAGEYHLDEEIEIINQVSLMLSMDSANMHIANLLGKKVVSIWGPTHPNIGFSPIGNEQNIIQIESKELSCRPCSIYGNKDCIRKDHACMEWIEVEKVYNKIINLLS